MNDQPPQQSPDEPTQPDIPPFQPLSGPFPPGSQPPYPGQPPVSPQRSGLRQRFARLPLFGKIGLLMVCLIGLIILGLIVGPQPSQGSQPTTVAQAPTPTFTPTPQPSHYPPKTEADLHALASKGDASAIHQVDAQNEGFPVCPQPKRDVIVDPSLTGQQLAEDLLAYFYAQQLDTPCGSLIGAYHSQAEVGDFYTAGRILVQTNDTNNPGATNVQYTLTLDLGDATGSQQEYIVTWKA